MKQVIVITGASSGFGALTARALAQAGHIVYASMRETAGRNASQVADVARYATEHGVDLRTVELDIASDESAKAGIARVIADNGRLDVVIHNAGHMSFGPAEAFTPEQFAVGVIKQRPWRHTALFVALFRSEGSDGFACGVLDHRAGRVHQGHQPLRSFRHARGQGACRGV
jgi:NAD(P)-dependent dehydrogenase (short-subunit alcohol dehydrogenase family)